MFDTSAIAADATKGIEMTHIKCAMQAAIEKTEARKYGQWSIAHVEEKAANLKGIGYSFSGDALRLVRDET